MIWADVAAYLLWGFIGLMVLFTLLPFSRLPHGIVRTSDFPRIQLLYSAVILLPIAQAILGEMATTTAMVLLVGIALVHTAYIARFTPIWKKQSVRAAAAELEDPDRKLSILVSNVKKSNRDYRRVVDLVNEIDPDILILIEVNTDWLESVSKSLVQFPERVEHPLDNGYGIALYSKLRLFECETRELLVNGIPSIRTGIAFTSGEKCRLYALHPEPPVPTFGTEGRDGEIGMVGLEVQDDELPAIVTGDLNDVAWSSTTRRFQKVSGLLDPRVGRGFFNSYDARIPIIRWPLDHLFHDARFRLASMQRLRHIGSDHFPMFFELVLTPSKKAVDLPPEPTDDDVAKIEDLVEVENGRDREPIGADWEDER